MSQWKHVYEGDPPGTVYGKTEHAKIKKAIDTHGFSIFMLLDKKTCDLHILKIWEVILAQPWADEFLIKITRDDGTVLDPANPEHAAEFLAKVKGKLSKATRTQFERGWTMHKQFGAHCDNKGYHDQLIWDLRSDPYLSDILDVIFGTKNWRMQPERKIQLLPGQGEGIGAHIDSQFYLAILRALNGDNSIKLLQSKVNFTKSRIRIAPGTHTHEFWLNVHKYYKHILNLDSKKPKNGLDKNDEDPMGIRELSESFLCPARSCVVFNQYTIHEHPKLGCTEEMVYGAYVGSTTDMSQVENVLQSFKCGEAPEEHPSGDKVHYIPLKYYNFPKHMLKKIMMLKGVKVWKGPLRPGEMRKVEHPLVRRSEKGKKGLYFVQEPNVGYVPPTLTELGLKNLVGVERMEKMRRTGEYDGSGTWTWRAGGSASSGSAVGGSAAGGSAAGGAAAGGSAAGKRKFAEIEVIEISSDSESDSDKEEVYDLD